MRHRIASGFGFGNSDRGILDNKGKLNKKYADDAYETYFSKQGQAEGFDFHVNESCVMVGLEPGYQYERLLIVAIHKNKEMSFIRDGYAWQGYGTGLRKKTRFYGEFKYNCKFVRFVDKWHGKLFWRSK